MSFVIPRLISLIISALDTATEKDIQKALQNLVQGRSSLSIAHRLSVRSFVVWFEDFG